jgi:Na+/melibiose symporter-like transporter
MLGEIADYQQHETGKRLEGHMQSLLFSLPGLIAQVLMLVTWFWQRSIGFEPKNYENVIILTEAQQLTAASWFNATSLISAASGLIMIIILCFYPLTKKKYSNVIAELEAKSLKIEKGAESVEASLLDQEG